MQWTSSVSSRSASVRLRAVRTRIGLPAESSSSGTLREPAGSSSITSSVSEVLPTGSPALRVAEDGAWAAEAPSADAVPAVAPILEAARA
jgi:hypothetical protein